MTVSVSDGPAIIIGYEYRLQIETEADLFPPEAQLTGQLRSKVSAAPELATLSTANDRIRRISARKLELVIPPEATATLMPGSAVLDLVRTDLAPPRHLAFLLELPGVRPVTRGL